MTPGGQRSKLRSRHQQGAAPAFGLLSFLWKNHKKLPEPPPRDASGPPSGVCASHPDEESHQLLSSTSWCLFQHSNYLSVTMQSGKATDGRRSETTSPCRQLAERMEPRCVYQSFLHATPRPGRRGALRFRGGRVLLSPALPPLPRVSPPLPPQSGAPRARDEREQLSHGGNKTVLGSPELQLTPTHARLSHGVDVLRLCQVWGHRRGRRPVPVHHAQLLRSIGERLPSSPAPPARSASAAGRHASASPTRAAKRFHLYLNERTVS